MDEKLLFFSTFVKHPMEVGSVVPSSKFLIEELMKNIDFENAKYIVEYGPGTGCITLQILKRARKDAKILCFETNRKFYNYLKKNITDKRAIMINDSAENIKKYLKKLDIPEVDYIVSAMPFSTLPKRKKSIIIEETKNTLENKDKFILYQYTNGLNSLLKEYFRNVKTTFVPLNIPPSFVYICEK